MKSDYYSTVFGKTFTSEAGLQLLDCLLRLTLSYFLLQFNTALVKTHSSWVTKTDLKGLVLHCFIATTKLWALSLQKQISCKRCVLCFIAFSFLDFNSRFLQVFSIFNFCDSFVVLNLVRGRRSIISEIMMVQW